MATDYLFLFIILSIAVLKTFLYFPKDPTFKKPSLWFHIFHRKLRNNYPKPRLASNYSTVANIAINKHDYPWKPRIGLKLFNLQLRCNCMRPNITVRQVAITNGGTYTHRLLLATSHHFHDQLRERRETAVRTQRGNIFQQSGSKQTTHRRTPPSGPCVSTDDAEANSAGPAMLQAVRNDSGFVDNYNSLHFTQPPPRCVTVAALLPFLPSSASSRLAAPCTHRARGQRSCCILTFARLCKSTLQ